MTGRCRIKGSQVRGKSITRNSSRKALEFIQKDRQIAKCVMSFYKFEPVQPRLLKVLANCEYVSSSLVVACVHPNRRAGFITRDKSDAIRSIRHVTRSRASNVSLTRTREVTKVGILTY